MRAIETFPGFMEDFYCIFMGFYNLLDLLQWVNIPGFFYNERTLFNNQKQYISKHMIVSKIKQELVIFKSLATQQDSKVWGPDVH